MIPINNYADIDKLDLMITRSDNSAANCLIDVAKWKNIDDLLHSYVWYGSEVTRRFLKRKFEVSDYEKIRETKTCALHVADFCRSLPEYAS